MQSEEEGNPIEPEIPDVEEEIDEDVTSQRFSQIKTDNLIQSEERNEQEEIEDDSISDKFDSEKHPRQRVIVLETDRIEIIIYEDLHEGEYTNLKADNDLNWNAKCFIETETGINSDTRSVGVQTNLRPEFENKPLQCTNCSLHCRLSERSSNSSSASNVYDDILEDL